MDVKIRPRVANVVSVVWLYLGSAWVVVGALGIYSYWSMSSAMSSMMARMGGAVPGVPAVFLWFPLGTLALGVFGVLGAVGLLRRQESGRRLLRAINFATIGLLAAFMWHWVATVTHPGGFSGDYVSADQVGMAVEGIVCGLLIAVPFVIIARKLAGRELCLWTSGSA